MTIILMILALLLDGVLSVKLPTTSFFLPLLTLTTIYLIYPCYKKKEKRYYCILITSGLLYDLLYTNLLFFHMLIFLFIGALTQHIYKNYHHNILKNLIYLCLIITLYESSIALILFLFQTTSITISQVFSQIVHSLSLNIIYALIMSRLIKLKA